MKRHQLVIVLIVLSGFTVIPASLSAQPDVMGQWVSAPALPWYPVHTSVLPTGKVMIWPGLDFSGNDPRIWDPDTQTVSPLTKPGYNIFCSGHGLLGDGQLLVAGGHIQDNVGLPTASLFNPFTGAWTALPDMNEGRWYPTVTALSNGDALVISGSVDLTVGNDPLPQVYQAATGTWRDLTSAQVIVDLYPNIFLTPNGQVFMSGPGRDTLYLDTSGTGAWTFIGLRVGPWRDYGGAVMYAPGKIVMIGGGDPPVNTAEVIDLNQPSPAWRATTSMRFARRQMNSVMLPDGKILVTGGTSGSGFDNATTPVYAAELWDPATERWTTLASATVPRLYHSSTVLLPDGRVLSVGGNNHPEVEIFSPPYLFKGTRPAITSAPASVNYGQSFFVATPDAASVTKVSMLRLSATTHTFNMGQHFSQLTFSAAAGGVNVTPPANGNLAPPGYYLLFLLNGNGVPSVGSIVKLAAGTAAPGPTGPTLTSLAPSSATAGGAALTLTVNGTNFVSGAVVQWNGASRTTTFASATKLTAAIPATDIASQGTAQVTVANPDGQISNALAFTVNPAPQGFTLTVSKSGPGSVTSSPAGINCGATCSAVYAPGTPVTLTATPNRGARFVGWSGACSGTGACTVTMDAAKSVSARFAKQ